MESDIGNIRALREWTRRYFYTKEDINFFMTKLNQGLKGYALMFIGPRNKKVTISPGNYEFTLNSDGWYRYLFFFERNQEITIAVQDGETITYQLDEYNDTINLSPWVIATPQMTSYYEPSGYVSASNTSWDAPWKMFDRSEASCKIGGVINAWIRYEFPEPIIIYKAKFITDGNGSRIGNPKYFDIQGSNNGTNWETIYTQDITYSSYYSITINIDIPAPKAYLYYRYFQYSSSQSGADLTGFKEIYLYTVDQNTTNYQIATPIMTSATAPSGRVTCSSSYDTTINSKPTRSWAPFTRDISTVVGWVSNKPLNTETPWLQYQFPTPKCIRKIKVWCAFDNNVYGQVTSFIFQASNDGINYVNLATCNMRHSEDLYNQPFIINNDSQYLYYRFLVTNTTNNNTYCAMGRIDMYEEV